MTWSASHHSPPGNFVKPGMNIALWTVAGLLAVLILASGAVKVVRPKEKLIESGYGWAEDWRPRSIRAIGILEVLAAIGLILPRALGITPVLVPLAAVGLVIIMLGAVVVHVRRGEAKVIGVPLLLLVASLFVAVGRLATG